MCGRFRPDEGAVAGYGNRVRVKSPQSEDVQIAEIFFKHALNSHTHANIFIQLY
ncbi:MAG: DUF6783 domain-containing protein [Blautia faecis]